MVDTKEKIQVGNNEDEFVDLGTFVQQQHLKQVVDHPYGGPGLDPARRKGRYSVVVFKSGVVLKCFVSGVSNSAYLMVSEANRGGRRHEIRSHAVEAIYQ